MNDSISQIYQKLRFLYQHKFLRETYSNSPYPTTNPIKYNNYSQPTYQQQSSPINSQTNFPPNSQQYTPYKYHITNHAKSKTQRVPRIHDNIVHMECRYITAPESRSFTENTRKKYRSLKSSNSDERNNKEKIRKAMYTLQNQSFSKDLVKLKVKSKAPTKKFSLIQMIEEKRLQNIRSKLKDKGQLSEVHTEGVDSNEIQLTKKHVSGYNRNSKAKKLAKYGPIYLLSQRQIKPNPEQSQDKDNQINPWLVSETQY